MKYIILAAGQDTEVCSLKDNSQKCLAKIDNKTVIDNILVIQEKL